MVLRYNKKGDCYRGNAAYALLISPVFRFFMLTYCCERVLALVYTALCPKFIVVVSFLYLC